jgi:hypothetical protein
VVLLNNFPLIPTYSRLRPLVLPSDVLGSIDEQQRQPTKVQGNRLQIEWDSEISKCYAWEVTCYAWEVQKTPDSIDLLRRYD